MASVFSFVFGYIIRVSTDGMPRIIFYLSGLLVWNSFKAILDGVGQTFVGSRGVFAKIYFPRLIPAISQVISNSVFFSLNLVVFLVFFVFYYNRGYDFQPNLWVLCLPLIFIWIAIAAFSFGLIVCSLTTKYRDLKFAMPFVLQCWMYGSPIIFPIRGISNPVIQKIMLCNPVATAVEFVRYSFTGHGIVNPTAFLCSSVLIIIVLIIGILSFNKVQYNFVDTI
jgi:lipopolysaccharide transport system permease protein